jgi:hypothetical protein
MSPSARPSSVLRLSAWLLGGLLIIPGCGGGGAPAQPGGGAGGGSGGGSQAPTGAILSPQFGAAGMLGETFDVSFWALDDGPATVRFLADADRDLGTTADQVVLFTGSDVSGSTQNATLSLAPPLAPGAYALVLQVTDADNPPLQIALPLGLTIYRGVAGVAPPRSNRYGVHNGVVVFSRGEAEDAAGSLNGDLDTTDGVMAAIDVHTGALTQPAPAPSLDVTGVAGGQVRPLSSEGGTLAWFTREADEGVNLNGANGQNPIAPIGGPDADTADRMISYVTPAASLAPVTNTYGGAASIVGRVDGLVILSIAEIGEGAGGTALNLDGDSFDSVIGYLDPAAAGPPYEWAQLVVFNVPAAAAAGQVVRTAGRGAIGFLTTEVGSVAGTDFNADGDGADTFLFLGNLQRAGGTGLPGNFTAHAGGAPGVAPVPVDPTAAFDVTADLHAGYYVDEAAHNVGAAGGAGTDVNGDGAIGFAPTFYDAATAAQTPVLGSAGPLNAPAGAQTMIYDQTRLFFTVQEAPRADPLPGTNGDGDGGADLAILYWVDHADALPVGRPLAVNFGGALTLQALSLDLGGYATRMAPGWIAVLVNEAANGNQDINGTGAVDMAYLLVDTTGTPAPIVHNLAVAPSAAGTFPLEGLFVASAGDEGIVLRLTEAANGVLDGDGAATETFLAYVSVHTPASKLVLDVGGDHCAAANGLIGVTANEALTGVDYDGNGSSTDYVFRVLDVAGTVRQQGRLCSVHSVPVTDGGDVWAYLRDEAVEGRDLNGDLDQVDVVLGLWVP